MDNKYNNSKIYKIEPLCDYDEGDIYIGSTTKKYLCERMAEHRKDYKRWKDGKRNKVLSFVLFDKYGLENCQIVLIENVHAQTKDELFCKEAHYIRTLKNLNMCIPNRNAKEYYMDNKEIIDDKNKKWRENHKDKVKEYSMNYKQTNKEMLNTKAKLYREANNEIIKEHRTQPIVCECGTTVNKWCISRHKNSQKHINLMKQKEEQI